MSNFSIQTIGLFAITVVLFGVLTIISRVKKSNGKQYDERQIIGRGKAYKMAFLTLLAYNLLYACVDASGIKWCESAVGMSIGIFIGVTAFAITAITKDAFEGVHTNPRYVILLFLLIIVVQSICFAAECIEGNIIENGVLTLNFISLFNAVCFAVILVVYLLHNRKVKLLEAGE